MPFWKRSKPADEAPVDPDARSPQLGIRNKDLALLGAMMQQGADLTQPRHALYFLYFGDRTTADVGAAEASGAGYACEVREPSPESPGQWPVVCERHDVVLDPPSVIAADDLFQGIADRLAGDFDGWEAAVRP